jgi:hypothetical protein
LADDRGLRLEQAHHVLRRRAFLVSQSARKYRFRRFSEIGPCGWNEVDMRGDYPRFKATYAYEDLVQYFLLSPADHAMVETCYGDANCHGVAVLVVRRECMRVRRGCQ